MKNTYNRGGYREADDSLFDDGYDVGVHNADFWMKCAEYEKFDQSEMTFQGRLFQKNARTKKWQAYHFELYSDRLIRITVPQANNNNNSTNNIVNTDKNGQANTQNNNNTNNPLQSSQQSANDNDSSIGPEYVPLNSSYLKKIKYADTSYANYKYGIRLQKGEIKTELFTESADNFNKLYEEIKRFCILPKFNKKYKVLTKFKSPQQMPQAHLFKCFRYSDSTQYCVRIVEKYQLTDQGRIAVLKETAILRKIDHPSLIKLYEVYEDETNIYLIYELLQGKDLKSKINELLAMDEKSVSDFLWKLLHGLSHLHARNAVHRDIRLDNIFFRAPNNFQDVCVSNFFLADFVDTSRCVGSSFAFLPSKQSYRKYGTPGYLAPEVIKNKPYDAKVDVFALGVIFYFLVFGRLPFEAKDAEETMKLNEKCEVDYSSPPFFGKFTSSAFDLMKKMLDKDPKNRGDAATLLNHTWFVKMRNAGDDGMRAGNLYAFPTLSTVQESTEAADLLSGKSSIDSRIMKNYEMPDMTTISKKNPSTLVGEFTNIRYDEEPHNSYVHNVVKDGSLIYEDEFVKETVSDKMCFLNKIQFMKVPSKIRHDSFHHHLSSRLGINIQEFYSKNPNNNNNNPPQDSNTNGDVNINIIENVNTTPNANMGMNGGSYINNILSGSQNNPTSASFNNLGGVSQLLVNDNSQPPQQQQQQQLLQQQALPVNSGTGTVTTPLSTAIPASKEDYSEEGSKSNNNIRYLSPTHNKQSKLSQVQNAIPAQNS